MRTLLLELRQLLRTPAAFSFAVLCFQLSLSLLLEPVLNSIREFNAFVDAEDNVELLTSILFKNFEIIHRFSQSYPQLNIKR